jgi:hypothetical protein
LYGCNNPEDHFAKLEQYLEAIRDLHGAEGLRAVGLEYRLLPCAEHLELPQDNDANDNMLLASEKINEIDGINDNNNDMDEEDEEVPEGALAFAELKRLVTSDSVPVSLLQTTLVRTDVTESLRSMDGSENIDETCVTTDLWTLPQNSSTPCLDVLSQEVRSLEEDSISKVFCNLCQHRLFHIESNTMVGEENRREFIADGIMYEEVSRLCQEHAQLIMMQEGQLKWVNIEEGNMEASEPIRILISSNHPIFNPDNCRPTVMICTGRGKVRAGIFSRQHMICKGLEIATAIPLVRDAVRRHLNVVIIDPNVHGEANGFLTFQKTMDYLDAQHFCQLGTTDGLSSRDLVILSHSASGGHMARYFLDKCESSFMKNIRAVAFTDSTHSIQVSVELVRCFCWFVLYYNRLLLM